MKMNENAEAALQIDTTSITLDAVGRIVVLDQALLDEITGAMGFGDDPSTANVGCGNVNCGNSCGGGSGGGGGGTRG